ncbi:stage III sporulation protein AG [Shouchella lehensis]|nr:stage III sporulation protein AG [Shouchella lehensis]
MGELNNEAKDTDWFKKWLPKQPDKKKRNISPRYLLLLGGIGVFFMLLGQLYQPAQEDLPAVAPEEEDATPVFAKEAERNSMEDYEMRYENELRDLLTEIVGVNAVSVTVNLAESERHVYEKNVRTGKQTTSETDREGGTRQVEDVQEEESVVIIRNGDKEEPLVSSTEKPSVAGVLVVAEGVENIQVKAFVVEAVTRLLDVAPHRVSVLPRKIEEE